MKKLLAATLLLLALTTVTQAQGPQIDETGIFVDVLAERDTGEYNNPAVLTNVWEWYQNSANYNPVVDGVDYNTAYGQIPEAYRDPRFRNDGALTSQWNGINGGADAQDAMIEIWFNPGQVLPTDPGTLWETGGAGTGSGIYIRNGAINLSVRMNSPNYMYLDNVLTTQTPALDHPNDTSVDLTPYLQGDFIQVVGFIDLGNQDLSLYLNGRKVSGAPDISGTVTDWTGNDGAAMGRLYQNEVGGTDLDHDYTDTQLQYEGDLSSLRAYTPTNWTYAKYQILNNYIATVGSDYANFDFDLYSPGLQETSGTINTDNNYVVRDYNATVAAGFTDGAIFVCGNATNQGVLTLNGNLTNGYITLGNDGTLNVANTVAWTGTGEIHVVSNTASTINLAGDLQNSVVIKNSGTLNIRATGPAAGISAATAIDASTGGLTTNLQLIGGNAITGNILLGDMNDTVTISYETTGGSTSCANINFGTGTDTLTFTGGSIDNTANPLAVSAGAITGLESARFITGAEDGAFDLTDAVITAELQPRFAAGTAMFVTDANSVAGKKLTLVGTGAMGDNDFTINYSGVATEATFDLQTSAVTQGITWTGATHTATFVGTGSQATTTISPFLFNDPAGQTLNFVGGDSNLNLSNIIFSNGNSNVADFTGFTGVVQKMTLEATTDTAQINAPAAEMNVTDGIDVIGPNTNTTLNLTNTVNADVNLVTPGTHALTLGGTGSLEGDVNLLNGGQTVQFNSAVSGNINVNGAGTHSIASAVTLPGAIVFASGVHTMDLSGLPATPSSVAGGAILQNGADVTFNTLPDNVLASLNVNPGATLRTSISDATGGAILVNGNITANYEDLVIDTAGVAVVAGKEFLVIDPAAGSLLYDSGEWSSPYASNLNVLDYAGDLDLIYFMDGNQLKGTFGHAFDPGSVSGVTNPDALLTLMGNTPADAGSPTLAMQDKLTELSRAGASNQELDDIVQQFTQSMANANFAQNVQANQNILHQVGMHIDNPAEIHWSAFERTQRRGQSTLTNAQFASTPSQSDNNLWMLTFGYAGEQATKQKFAPYDTSSWGVTVGFDTLLAKRYLVGFAYAYSDNRLDSQNWTTLLGTTNNPSNVETQLHAMLAFSRINFSNALFMTGKIGGSWSEISGTRYPTPTSQVSYETGGSTLLLETVLGYNVVARPSWLVTPKLGFGFLSYAQKAYEERTVGGYSAVDNFQNAHCYFDAVVDGALRISENTIFRASLGYRMLAGADGVVMSVQSDGLNYNINAITPASNIVMADIGAELRLTQNLKFLAEYTFHGGEGSCLNAGTGTFVWQF